jgi:ABC-type multidrug transport system ATPase subunit
MRITALEKKLGDFSLRIESLVLDRPGVYGLIGPNGCGKTTTARLLAALLSPDKGSVDPEGLSFRDITFLPLKPYMMDDTVYNNLVYPLRLRNIKPDPRLCDEYLDRMGFLRRKKQRARSLSAGEQQKLAMLRALIFEPRFVIIDEALADLDIDSLDMFEGMILDIQNRKPLTWLVISHRLSHIRRICDYVFFMSSGRLEAEGPVEKILVNPEIPLVKSYIKHESI